jgi:hypothetical protein
MVGKNLKGLLALWRPFPCLGPEWHWRRKREQWAERDDRPAAGIAIAGAAIGAGIGQGRAVAAVMESIGRNPNSADRIQTPMILGSPSSGPRDLRP